MSLVTLLYIYNQQDRSGSLVGDVDFVFVDFHISVVFVLLIVVLMGGLFNCSAGVFALVVGLGLAS
jgi:hypothetical protein